VIEAEVPDQPEYEIDEELENEDYDEEEDDEVLGGDLELDDGELDGNELRMLGMAEAEDDDDLNDIENTHLRIKSKGLAGKKRQKPVKIQMEDEVELEYEREDLPKAREMIKAKTKY